MLFNPFKLKSTLARNASADPDDTFKMKNVLGSLGYYKSADSGMNRYPDERLFKGIERFQSDFGLKKDGAMRPGGEMVEALSNLSRRPAIAAIDGSISTSKKRWWDGGISATPSLRPAFPGAVSADPVLFRAKPAEPAGPSAVSGEVVSSNARTVAAARKSGDHSGLAKLHARAVTDFGDKALAEVADFDSQLRTADPSAHKSWRTAFSEQAPEAEKRLRLMSETAKTPKQETPPENSSKDPFAGINRGFIKEQEQTHNDVYTVTDKDEKPIGKGGATVGTGVDLGRMNQYDLDNLVKNNGLSPALADKLKPYLGKTEQEAVDFVAKNPLTLSDSERDNIDEAKYLDTLKKSKSNVDELRGAVGGFDKLPDAVKTVVYDQAIHYGPDFLKSAPKFKSHLKNGDTQGMIRELRNYHSPSANPPKSEIDRLERKAKLLEKALRSGKLSPRF